MNGRKIDDLSRPKHGERNIVKLSSGIRFMKTISRKFFCPKCHTFCGELIPILDAKVREWMRKNRKSLFSPEVQVKVFCFSGCHHRPGWGWEVFDWGSIRHKEAIRSWPKEWGAAEIRKAELDARRANEAYKGEGGTL